GSSNAPLLGSTAAEGLQRIGRTSIATRWRSCGLPQSASCSENFVIPPDVFGQTLRGRGRWSIGRDFRKVGTREHEKETALRVENNDALWICAIRLDLAAIRERVLPSGERPGSDQLVLDRPLLADCAVG